MAKSAAQQVGGQGGKGHKQDGSRAPEFLESRHGSRRLHLVAAAISQM
jgi:hypothetical protein